MTLEASEWLTLLGFVLALTTFVVGLFQYRQGQRWKALEFVSSEIKEFLRNPDARNAMQMLDYNGRPIHFIVPSPSGTAVKLIQVTDALVISALTTHLERGDRPITEDEGLIRQAFDTFFDYLAQFNHYIVGSNLIQYRDFHPYLSYWLAIMTDQNEQRKPRQFVSQLNRYLDVYD